MKGGLFGFGGVDTHVQIKGKLDEGYKLLDDAAKQRDAGMEKHARSALQATVLEAKEARAQEKNPFRDTRGRIGKAERLIASTVPGPTEYTTAQLLDVSTLAVEKARKEGNKQGLRAALFDLSHVLSRPDARQQTGFRKAQELYDEAEAPSAPAPAFAPAAAPASAPASATDAPTVKQLANKLSKAFRDTMTGPDSEKEEKGKELKSVYDAAAPFRHADTGIDSIASMVDTHHPDWKKTTSTDVQPASGGKKRAHRSKKRAHRSKRRSHRSKRRAHRSKRRTPRVSKRRARRGKKSRTRRHQH